RDYAGLEKQQAASADRAAQRQTAAGTVELTRASGGQHERHVRGCGGEAEVVERAGLATGAKRDPGAIAQRTVGAGVVGGADQQIAAGDGQSAAESVGAGQIQQTGAILR